MCWANTVGPNGETERLIDLAPSHVAALGLPGPGLYDVIVQPIHQPGQPEPPSNVDGVGQRADPVLPDTAMEMR